ncbi:hypothetical protein [Sphingomonas sp. 22R3R2A-7]|uniref:hypothetical protein n=1 Tax=Sphingomonas sp. 22R3R2A-7 TaxID=3050230 RepID=UPI002FE3B095
MSILKLAYAMSVAFVTMIPAAVAAQDALPADKGLGVAVGLTAGTLGIGPEVGFRISDHLGIRGNASFLGINGNYESDDLEYDGKIKLKSFGAMLDVYPMGGHFRISGGARINKSYVRLHAVPSQDVEIGDDVYTPAQIGILKGRAEVKNFSPALTLGWSGKNRKGFMFGFDAGVLFQGTIRVREFTATGELAGDAVFTADLERERISLQDDVNDYKVYPILQLSVGYRF